MSDWKSDLVVAYKDHGLRVHEGPNWRNFGVGDWAEGGRPQAALKHQFMWPAGNSDQGAVDMLTKGYDTGEYFLNPPVANNFLGKSDDGDVYMIAGRVAQHGGRGVRAVYDRARQGLPPLGDGQNAPGPDDWGGASYVYWGTEMHHYWKEPFHQYDALLRMSLAECQVFGWNENHILEHSNSSLRKYEDLIALDGNKLRSDLARLLKGGGGGDWFDAATPADIRAVVIEALQ